MSSSEHSTHSNEASEKEAKIRESLRRCSEATIQAALEFNRTGAKEQLLPIVLGILERYVEPDLRPKLRESGPELRLIEDLALDSLTLMEIIILVEESLGISISNDEARSLRTVEDVRAFAEAKAAQTAPSA